MVNANSKLQVNNSLLKIIVTFSLAVFLNSCGSPTTVITRGDTSVIDKERIIMQGIALDTYYKRFEKLNNLTYPLLTKSLKTGRFESFCFSTLFKSPSSNFGIPQHLESSIIATSIPL